MPQRLLHPTATELAIVQRVAVGSTNPVKVAAVRAVVDLLWPAAQVEGIAVDSGVSAQPLSDAEMVAGAEARARAAQIALDADLGVGLEGGVQQAAWGCLLSGWAAVVDGQGRVGLGSAGRILLPPALVAAINRGEELGPAVDRLSGRVNTHQGPGAVGVLTAGLVRREQAFRVAITYALARFLHPAWYADLAPTQQGEGPCAGLDAR